MGNSRRPLHPSIPIILTLLVTVAIVALSRDAWQSLSNDGVHIFVSLAVVCVIGAFFRGAASPNDGYPLRWRKRAWYLRWLSMACLSAIGALVTVAFTNDAGGPHTAQVAVLGIVSAILVWVYRYIIMLSYFYDARADSLAVLKSDDDDRKRQSLKITEIADFKRILELLSPPITTLASSAAQIVESVRPKSEP